MFTGIVEEFGIIRQIEKKQNLILLTVTAKKIFKKTAIGESIAVDGVCLTVAQKTSLTATFDCMKETLKKTTLGYLKIGSTVNLERALKANSRISGHFVQGHVDGIGIITKKNTRPHYAEFQIAIDTKLMPNIVSKGSICLDGISLTVGEVREGKFSIYIIPHTLKITTLGMKGLGDKVNIETDILAKYIRNPKKLKQLLTLGNLKRSRYSAVFA